MTRTIEEVTEAGLALKAVTDAVAAHERTAILFIMDEADGEALKRTRAEVFACIRRLCDVILPPDEDDENDRN